MCGICGELSFDGPVSLQALASMTARLQHRGPDHAATFQSPDGRAGLGFRRLSIIDLREAGNQPIGNEDGSIQLVFNGEIYNFRDLRKGLVERGHRFRSNADSEVIVHLYEERGERAIDELDGMFALSIWDGRAGRLTLARDRAGKKPLYLWQDAHRAVFGSEIKALLAHPALRIEIDEEAIPYYFMYGYVPHPRTVYRGIRQIEPGTVETFDRDGKAAARRYWQLRFPDVRTSSPQVLKPSPSDRASVAARVRELVTAAVERRLMSDVPLGAFLSGGLDSTIIVGIMSRLMKEPVRTFSIGFEGDAAFDETDIARETAGHFGTAHTEFKVKPAAMDLLDTLVYHYDGPFADSSAIPTYLVAKLTRQHVTVALTGDGGDEVFAGYLRFAAALAAERVPGWVAGAAGIALAALPNPGNERHWVARGRRFARASGLPLMDRIASWAGAFFDDVESLLDPGLLSRVAPLNRGVNLKNLAGVVGASPLNRLLAANFHSYLHDDLLVKADRMSMANSLEARAPFLDRALIEYVAGLPDHYKLDGQTTKAILREAFADMVPDAVKRAGKKGFGVPLDAWFRGDLGDYLRDTLLVPSAQLRPYVSQDYVGRLLDDHAARRANHGHRLWTLLTFERWLALLPSWRARV
jgi:asparagine synthase (glutamine-hydrolysing)